MSGTSRLSCAKCTSNAQALREKPLSLLPAVTLLDVMLAKISNFYSWHAGTKTLIIFQNPSYSLDIINFNIISLKEFQKFAVCIANACTELPSQSTKHFSRWVKWLKLFFVLVAYQQNSKNENFYSIQTCTFEIWNTRIVPKKRVSSMWNYNYNCNLCKVPLQPCLVEVSEYKWHLAEHSLTFARHQIYNHTYNAHPTVVDATDQVG